MAFVPYSEGKLLGYGSGLPRALSSHSAQQQAAAAAKQAGQQSRGEAPLYTTRPNIVRQLTGGLQAQFQRIQNKHAEARRKQQAAQQAGGGSGGARDTTAYQPTPDPALGDWTRSDGFLKISTTLPLLNL